MKGRHEDRRRRGQEDKGTWGQEDSVQFKECNICQVQILPNCNLPMSVYKYTLSVITLRTNHICVCI